MPKNNLFQPAIILCVICLITTGLMALTYNVTQEARDAQELAAANANRLALYPDAAGFTVFELPAGPDAAAGLLEACAATDTAGKVIGYVFTAESAGYGGNVPVMLAVSADGKVAGIKILDNDETPGLGKKVGNEAFWGQFVGQGDLLHGFAIKVPDSNVLSIDAVSGATISSRAVVSAVNIAIRYFQQNVAEVKK